MNIKRFPEGATFSSLGMGALAEICADCSQRGKDVLASDLINLVVEMIEADLARGKCTQ